MIGWLVNYGYCFTKFPNNISEVTITDKKVPFSIPQIGSAMSYIYDGKQNIQMAEGVVQYLQDSLGADYYYVHGIGTYSDLEIRNPFQTIYATIPRILPSITQTAPVLRQYMETNSTAISVIIFPKQRLLCVVSYSSGDNNVYPYVIETDGSLTKLLTGTFSYLYLSPTSMMNRDGKFYCFIGEPDLEQFKNLYGIHIESGSNPNKFTISTKRKSSLNSDDYTFLRKLFSINPDYSKDPQNPYEPGGPSGPTDPKLPPGTFDDESDSISDSPLPTISAANTGFTRIYNPTLSQVKALARYLWTDPDVIQTIWNHIKQFFENPMEAIIGFNLVPVPVPDGGTEKFALMYIDTGVSMTVAANQFVDLDCGSVELKRYYGSALDQSPYTKVSCFLPYIGTVNLNTDEVMGTTLQVKYRVDIVSGSCVAKIFVDGNCLYQYSGHCAITIPISSADFSSYVSAAISVGKLAAAAITAGAGAAMAAGVAEASQQTNQVVTTTQVTNTARNPSTGRQITTGTTTTVQTRESPADQSSTQASFSGLSPQNVANTVGAIMSSKPHIEHSGSFSGNSGYLGVRRPFLIIERPNMCMPANYQALNGFPSMITMELSTCKGFTRVQQVQLTGMGRATNPEQAEILELLKSGVIL